MTLFFAVCVDGVRSSMSWLVHHRAVGLYPLLLAAAAYTAAAAVPGPHTPYVTDTRVYAEFVVWQGGH